MKPDRNYRLIKFLLLAIAIPAICSSQPLTQASKEQIEKLIVEKFTYGDHKYESFKIDSGSSTYDNLRPGDFNHDGIQDLLVSGTSGYMINFSSFRNESRIYTDHEIVIIVGDKSTPRKAIFLNRFFRGFDGKKRLYPKVISLDQKDFILITYDVFDYRQKKSQTFHDTLSVENDHVIPFTKSQSNAEVTNISFKTSHCFGTCPVFEMTINQDLSVQYNGIDHVDKRGQFSLVAEAKDWHYLTTVISNLRIKELKDNYNVNWTDDQTGYLTIAFKDGSKKEIRDYGMVGTYGLSVLYDYFFELLKF